MRALAVVPGALILALAPAAHASAPDLCSGLGGDWDGQYCHSTVLSERNATRDIKVAIPGELVDNPVTGPVIRDYLTTLVGNWRSVGVHMAADSFGEENVEILRHGDILTAVFHEDYHADGPRPNNAYRTFTFDMAQGRQLKLTDLIKPGADLNEIATSGQPFIQDALDRAAPQHDPGSYPFIAERWTPDKVYSGGYKAWALGPGELILYMPDYPVAHDAPINYTTGIMQWSMDGGTVEAHIPLSALAGVLRPEYV